MRRSSRIIEVYEWNRSFYPVDTSLHTERVIRVLEHVTALHGEPPSHAARIIT